MNLEKIIQMIEDNALSVLLVTVLFTVSVIWMININIGQMPY